MGMKYFLIDILFHRVNPGIVRWYRQVMGSSLDHGRNEEEEEGVESGGWRWPSQASSTIFWGMIYFATFILLMVHLDFYNLDKILESDV